MNAYTSLWALLLQPQGSHLLPFAKSRTWSFQSESLLEWARLHECNDRIRSPGSLWTILHQTPVPNGATWADLIAEHTPEDLPVALKGRSATEGPGFASWNVRWLVNPHSVHRQFALSPLLRPVSGLPSCFDYVLAQSLSRRAFPYQILLEFQVASHEYNTCARFRIYLVLKALHANWRQNEKTRTRQ